MIPLQDVIVQELPNAINTSLPSIFGFDAVTVLLIGSLSFDVIIFAYLAYTMYRDMTGIWAVIEDSDVAYLKRFSGKALKERQLHDKENVYQIITKPKLLLKPFGISVPCFYINRNIACTVELNDPRDPEKKYVTPATLSKGLDTTAEDALQTVHIDRGTPELIGYIGIGAVIGFIACKLLGV